MSDQDGKTDAKVADIDNPYCKVDWETCHYIHSMSHQHSGDSVAECEAFYEMGYRHFAFSNYYPSTPIPSLPAAFCERHPDVIFSPNAEHHSFTDSALHFNGLGSLYSSGYGCSVSHSHLAVAPLIASFNDLHAPAKSEQIHKSVYRLDIIVEAQGEKPEEKDDVAATLTVEGAVKCAFGDDFISEGELRAWPLVSGVHQIYLRAEKPTVTVTLDYSKSQFEVRRLRLMQGTNLPWREAFLAALDGEVVNSQRNGGLKYAEGGGITLNHPHADVGHYLPMLDFDPRVLGIEVWNYRTRFGAPLHFYELWDDILRTGRRCWGFFVKDHRAFERGRNVLLLPDLTELSPEERECTALYAYRNGAFFGSIGASSIGISGEIVASFDQSEFRFTRIAVRRDDDGRLLALWVSVAGQDVGKRPNIQLRFITAKGIELMVDAPTAEFSLKMDHAELLARRFIRVEAFAYPETCNAGELLSKEKFSQMDVVQISSLQDEVADCNSNDSWKEAESLAPSSEVGGTGSWNVIASRPRSRRSVPVVDMIFSQPLRFFESDETSG